MPGPKRILCVEDHEDTRDLLCMSLGESRFEVLPVGTIEKAVDLLESQTIDGFLLDRWLPDGDGLDLCRRIRSLLPEAPIIVVSAAAYEDDRAEALDAGASAFLAKPTDPMTVIAQLIEAFGNRRPGTS